MLKNVSHKISVMAFAVIFSLAAATDALADRNRDQTQAKLDAACEQAREKKLAPMRKQFVDDCVKNREQRDRKSCEFFYSDFGAQSGNRAPLFYDLPECVEAFDYQNSQRRR